MTTAGQHLLVEYHGCNRGLLDDDEHIEATMTAAAIAAGATLVSARFHRFAPQGVSGVVVVAESHLSIHTWPEHGYAAADFYTCGDCNPERAHELLVRALRAERAEVMVVGRGGLSRSSSMRVLRHDAELHADADRSSDPADAILVHRNL